METHTKIATGISLAVGLGLKKLLKEGWQKRYNEDPPGEKVSENIHWGKLILWTLISGLLLRLIRVGIKRSISVVMNKQGMLT